MTKLEIQALLQKSDIQITFRKADETIRVLNATLQIPLDEKPIEPEDQMPRRPLADTHLVVFDRDIQEWRTVVIERILEVKAV